VHMLLYVSGVNCNLNSNHTWHNYVTDFLHFGKFPPQICEYCGVTYRYNYEVLSAL